MSNPQKVSDLLKRIPKGSCDDCLGRALGINRHQVHTITSSLALTAGFTRSKSVCPQNCTEREKFVTSYNSVPQNHQY